MAQKSTAATVRPQRPTSQLTRLAPARRTPNPHASPSLVRCTQTGDQFATASQPLSRAFARLSTCHVVALLPAHVLFGLDVAPTPLAEYTVKNLQFALHVEPKNAAAERKILWAQDVQAKGEPTVPSTIGDELEHNPFMRVREPTVREHVGGGTDDVDVMRKLRNFKDTFAGSSRPWIPGGGPLPGL